MVEGYATAGGFPPAVCVLENRIRPTTGGMLSCTAPYGVSHPTGVQESQCIRQKTSPELVSRTHSGFLFFGLQRYEHHVINKNARAVMKISGTL